MQMGSLFGDLNEARQSRSNDASYDEEALGDVEEQMRQQSGVEIDLESGTISRPTVTSE